MSFITEEGAVRLGRVAAWLEAGAPHVVEHNISEFNMQVGVSFLSEAENQKALTNPSCGSMCCIAGAVCQFEETFKVENATNPTTINGKNVGEVSWRQVMNVATDLLGISDEDADALFMPNGFEHRTISARTASAVIRHYLATGEIDWDRELEIQ